MSLIKLTGKKWIIFTVALLLVVSLGLTVFFACSGGGNAPQEVDPPASGESYSLVPPADGSLPEDHTAYDNLGYIIGRLAQRDYYHTDSVSTAEATALLGIKVTQNVTGTKDYKDGVLIVSSVSVAGSSFAPSKALQRFIGEDKAVVRTAASSNKNDWNGAQTEWASGEPSEILSREDYVARYGLWPTEFSDYIFREDTILSFGNVTKEGDEYVLSFTLDPQASTYYYRNQMVTMGDLDEPPVFSSVEVTLCYRADWSVTEMRVVENYTSKKGFSASVVGNTVVTYSYEEADVDVSDYEEYFIHYAQAETTGAAEEEHTADYYITSGFAPVLANERTAFSLEARIGEAEISGTAVLAMEGGAPRSLALALGELRVLLDLRDGNDVYLQYRDFLGKASLSEILDLIGMDGSFSLDGLMPVLENMLAGGIVEKDGEDVAVHAQLSLGEIAVPLTFGFHETETGVSWTYINVSFELAGMAIEAHIEPAPAEPVLPAIDIDTGAAEDIMPIVRNLLSIVQEGKFAAEFDYVGEGFAINGNVTIDALNGAAAGTIEVAVADTKVIVNFALADKEVYLHAGGVKVRANAGEWLDAVLPLLGAELPEETEFELSSVLGGLADFDLGAVLKQFTLQEGNLTLVLDGDALLAAFLPEAGIALGDLSAQYDGETNTFAFTVLGAEVSLAGTEEKVSLPADADSYVVLHAEDVLKFVGPIKALAQSKDLAFEVSGDVKVEGVSLHLDVAGEVWFADANAPEVYLEIAVNDGGLIRINYANGEVRLAYGNYGMTVAESELKTLAEKFSSLLSGNENAPSSLALLGTDGLDIAALLENVKLLAANGNGLQFAADLSSLLEGLNLSAQVGASGNGLTLADGSIAFAGLSLKNVSAQINPADNAFTPDFAGVEMKEDLADFLLNALFGSDKIAAEFTYAGEGFAIGGEVVLEAINGRADGVLEVSVSGTKVSVRFALANGEVYLHAGGVKVRANAGEWLDAVLPLLGAELPEETEFELSSVLGGLAGLDINAILKQFTLQEGNLSLVLDGDALLAVFAPEAEFVLGDIVASYDGGTNFFALSLMGADVTLAGTEEEVSLPADADSYVVLHAEDVLKFIEPIQALAQSKDLAFEVSGDAKVENISLHLDIAGEVWLADANAPEMYLEIAVNDGGLIRINYANGEVRLAYGNYGMTVAESELKTLAEKFSSLLSGNENAPSSLALLGTDGLDIAALLENVKLLAANGNGLQFAADLPSLLEGLNLSAQVGASGNGLTLADGSIVFAGLSLKNVSAQINPADNAFTPDFSGVEMKEDLADFLLNALFGSDKIAAEFTYAGEGFAINGNVTIDALNGAAAGTIEVAVADTKVIVNFALADKEVYLHAGGVKVRANAGEWLDAVLPLLGAKLPEETKFELSSVLGGLAGLDINAILKQFTLQEGNLSLVLDGDALLAVFAPEAEFVLGDIVASYDGGTNFFALSLMGADVTLAGTEEEVSLPSDAESYVVLHAEDVLKFVGPIKALAQSKDLAFEVSGDAKLEGIALHLDIAGEVWLADANAPEVYLEIAVNDGGLIRINYANGEVRLAYGNYGMTVAESELKALAEKFSSLLSGKENAPSSLALLGTDGLDIAALLENVKLLAANGNGLQFAADLSSLLEGLNLSAQVGASGNGLTLADGSIAFAGLSLKNVSAQINPADNAFTPDFSGVEICANVFEFILNSYVQFAGSEYLSVSLKYEGEDMTADLSAAFRFKQSAENVAIDLAAEAVIAAGGSSYYIQVRIVDDRAYIYFSLVGFEESNYYPELVSANAVPLRAQFTVSSLFSMSTEAMPLIVSILGMDKNELYYFNFVVEILGGTYETINSDIFGVKDAREWADLILGIIDEYTGSENAAAKRAASEAGSSLTVLLDAENRTISLSGVGLKAAFAAGSEFEITAPAAGAYTDYSSLAGLMKVMMDSITQTQTVEDAQGNAVQSAEINRYYYMAGAITGSIGSLDLTTIDVAASVYLHEDYSVTINIRLEIDYFIAVFNGDTVLEMTIENGMVYMVRTQTSEAGFLGIERQLDTPIVLCRAMPLDHFFGGILGQLGFLFNFSDTINDQIVGASAASVYSGNVTDIGSILTSFSFADSSAPAWTLGLDLSSVTDGVLSDAFLVLNASEEGILQGMDFNASLSILTLSAALDYINPGELMESGHEKDITSNVAGKVSSLFSGALAGADWGNTSFIEGKTATLTFVADGQTLASQAVAYDTSTGTLLTQAQLSDLSAFNGGGYTYSWGGIGPLNGDMTLNAVKAPKQFTVTIESEYEIDGWEYVRTEGGLYIYELTYTYGTQLALPVGAEYEKTYAISAFTGEEGDFSAIEGVLFDIRLRAVWEEIEYTVTYTVFGEAVAEQVYGYGDALIFPEIALPAGYAFAGWNEAPEAVLSDMTIEALLSVTVTLGSDFAAEGFAQGEGGWFREYALTGTSADDFALGITLSCAGYTQFGWWRDADGWQYVTSLAGMDGESVWAAWISDVSVEITEARKSLLLWTINGRYTGGTFSGRVSEQIAASAGITSSAQAWLKLSKDGVTDFDTLNSGNSVSVSSDGSFGKGSMTSFSDLAGSAQYGGAKVAVTYTCGDLSLTLEGVGWKRK